MGTTDDMRTSRKETHVRVCRHCCACISIMMSGSQQILPGPYQVSKPGDSHGAVYRGAVKVQALYAVGCGRQAAHVMQQTSKGLNSSRVAI